jgi:hypothetical protein
VHRSHEANKKVSSTTMRVETTLSQTMGAVTVRFTIVRRRFRLMYDISYISWNHMFYFGLGGLTSRACHLANFYHNVLNLVSTDGKSRIRHLEGFDVFLANDELTAPRSSCTIYRTLKSNARDMIETKHGTKRAQTPSLFLYGRICFHPKLWRKTKF